MSRPELGGFQDLMALDGGAAAIWAQVIAWDLFLGQWMYRESRRLAIHPLVMSPLLALTVLLSPIGVLLFLGVRAIRSRTPQGRTARSAAAGTSPSDA